ncbi:MULTISPECIES: SMP-30/gluconolactonase/LRE family protein [Amycolatopsis]|uniref:Sugar lactone lactonase YvrE n=1 Tax=Amycolatopsis thermoflava TaxID=84480 RepID=A0A3N2H5G1_9PSEU|nr:SMP-30/gluconolactonase/LRE family protein [Amycolatopsis thermoflava]ROS44162.1 sugar lactone lactonase YvrE [Amycolatopsis thermoflava]
MPRVEAWELVKEFLFPGRSGHRAIPPLDGGLTPNDELDAVATAIGGLTEPEDVCLDERGDLYVSTADRVVRVSGPDFRHSEVFATLPGPAGALEPGPDGLLVGVAGTGLMRLGRDGAAELVTAADESGVPIHCPTDVALAGDGTIYLTDGSTRHHGRDWVRDLMEQNARGRLLRHDPRSGRTTVLAGGLAYASGVSLTPGQDALVVCEAWAHRVRLYPLAGGAGRTLRENLPGYPGRINPAPGGYWLAMFALRTQLVEFVLTQRDYVEEMMRTIEPDYWIRPALRGLDSGLEPLQGGQIRKLGVIKPWAPPRSYGLVARLDEEGYVVSSMHSRGGGRRHGVTSARQCGSRLFIAVHGGDQVLVTGAGEA